MKVFISWSGERSGGIAKALREWLPLLLDDLALWLSKADLQAGERWSLEIAKELDASNFGIICITKDNLNAAWIMFEAGALAKSLQDGRVIPLLFDVDFKEVTGPLAQFQAKKFDPTGMKEIVLALNQAAEQPVAEATVTKRFDALWPELEKQVVALPKPATPSKKSRPQDEILEELVAGIRSVESRVRDLTEDDLTPRRRRIGHHLNSRLFAEAAHRLSEHPRDSVQLLVFSSLLREDAPWLYELALDVYRAEASGQEKVAKRSRRQLMDAIEFLDRNSFFEKSGVDPYIIHRLRSQLRTARPATPKPRPAAEPNSSDQDHLPKSVDEADTTSPDEIAF